METGRTDRICEKVLDDWQLKILYTFLSQWNLCKCEGEHKERVVRVILDGPTTDLKVAIGIPPPL